MKIVLFQKVIIRSPLSKSAVNEILANCVGVEGPEGKIRFVSGIVKEDYFRIKTIQKAACGPECNPICFTLISGKVLEDKEGCRLEANIDSLILPISLAIILSFGLAGLTFLVRGLFFHYHEGLQISLCIFVFISVIYFASQLGFNSEAYALKAHLLQLTKGEEV